MSKLVIFITGSNTGLGFETVKSLVSSSNSPGYHVFLGSRSMNKGNEAILKLQPLIVNKNEVEAVQIDITDDESIKNAFQYIKAKVDHINVLVNNAGAQFDQQYAEGKLGLRELWSTTYNINVSSTHIITETFMPLLHASSSQSRIIFISSATASLEEASQGLPLLLGAPPKGWPKPPSLNLTSYRTSKAAVSMVMLEWKRILRDDDIKVFGLDPGFLATNLGGMTPEKLKSMGALDSNIGANFIKTIIDGERDADHGKILRRDGIMPW